MIIYKTISKRIAVVLFILAFMSCNRSNEQKAAYILQAKDVFIQVNSFGGLAGYSEQILHLKKKPDITILIENEDTDYQTFSYLYEDKMKLFKLFVEESIRSNDLERKIVASCIGGNDYEYILKSGFTSLKLRPSRACDSIFSLILSDEN